MSKPKLDTYLNLCTQVYDLSKPTAPQDAYPFYRDYALAVKGPILEPMCGTGRFLLPFLAEGIDICGFDASEAMLNSLLHKAKTLKLNPFVWAGYVEDLECRKQFNLIFIPSGSFGLIIDLESAKLALQRFYECLSPNGILLFEAETSYSVPKQVGTWRGSAYYVSENEMIVASFLDLSLVDGVTTTLCKYELVKKNLLVQTEVEKLKVRVYDPQSLIELLNEIGFSQIKLIKAFNKNKAPDSTDEVVVYECHK